MNIWTIKLYNYMDDYDTLYFKNEKIAKANFNALCEKVKGKAEFEKYEDAEGPAVSWFDPSYNDNSTYAVLCQAKIDLIESLVF